MVVWRFLCSFSWCSFLVLGACAAALVKLAFFPDSVQAAIEPSVQISDPVVAVERGSVVNALSLDGSIARDDVMPCAAR